MPIVSISLNEDIINDIDKLQKNLGFSGRSEIVRAGLRNMIAEQKERDTLQGTSYKYETWFWGNCDHPYT